MLLRLFLATIAVALIASAPPEEVDTGTFRTLDGTWGMTRMIIDGRDQGIVNFHCRFEFVGTRCRCLVDDRVASEFFCLVDVGRHHMDTDMMRDGQRSGEIRRGIYQLKDDVLIIAEGEKRPTAFSWDKGRARFIYHLKRLR
jgi:hypothetical protein